MKFVANYGEPSKSENLLGLLNSNWLKNKFPEFSLRIKECLCSWQAYSANILLHWIYDWQKSGVLQYMVSMNHINWDVKEEMEPFMVNRRWNLMNIWTWSWRLSEGICLDIEIDILENFENLPNVSTKS